jgi:hypothetical protein
MRDVSEVFIFLFSLIQRKTEMKIWKGQSLGLWTNKSNDGLLLRHVHYRRHELRQPPLHDRRQRHWIYHQSSGEMRQPMNALANASRRSCGAFRFGGSTLSRNGNVY